MSDNANNPASVPKPWSKVETGRGSFKHERVTRPVHNIRNHLASEFTTDITGFDFGRWPSSTEPDFTNDTAVRGPFYADVKALLRANCEALPSNQSSGNKVRKIVIFDHTIRRRLPGAARVPLQQVHVDQTPAAVVARVRRYLPPDEADEALAHHRFQLINVWKPIRHAAVDHPLAVIDWRSTTPQDFIPVDLLYPTEADLDNGDRRGKEKPPRPTQDELSTEGYEVGGETLSVTANAKHRFYYVKDMTPGEVLLLKCYDSWGEGEPDGMKDIAVRTPHTAFEDPCTPPDAAPRESIEVRALVFYEM